MFWFLVLLIMVGAGFYFYQRMRDLEQEIRAEQARDKELQQSGPKGKTGTVVAEKVEPDTTETVSLAKMEPPPTIEADPILDLVHHRPGLAQTDLYSRFPEMSRKQLQQAVRNLVEQGRIRRERSGNSYRLFPL